MFEALALKLAPDPSSTSFRPARPVSFRSRSPMLALRFAPGVNLNASIGDLLRNETGLAGLKDVLDGSGASFSASASNIHFDVTFGVLLLQDTSDITPLRGTATAGSSGNVLEDTGADFTDGANDPRLGQVVKKTSAPTGQCTIAAVGQHTITCAAGSGITWSAGNLYDVDGGLIDRFYMKVDNAADKPELAVEDLTVAGSASLEGKVGFMEIEAGVDSTNNTFGVTKADNTKPVLRVDIKTPAPFVAGGTTIPDAIGVGERLCNLDSAHLSAVCNLKATANLGITASVDGKELASGGVGVNWPTAFKPNSCEPDFSTLSVDADTDFDLSLRNFDPFPSVSGTHTAATSTNLFDGTKNFKHVGFDPANPESDEHGAKIGR